MPRVTLATRALPASRALLNEAQIMAYITARWDVDVVTTTFNGTLYDSMDLMQHTDIFLGMHGAGWTNALFLSKVSTMAQEIYPSLPLSGIKTPVTPARSNARILNPGSWLFYVRHICVKCQFSVTCM